MALTYHGRIIAEAKRQSSHMPRAERLRYILTVLRVDAQTCLLRAFVSGEPGDFMPMPTRIEIAIASAIGGAP